MRFSQLIQAFITYTNDVYAIERTLRFVQGSCSLIAQTANAAGWPGAVTAIASGGRLQVHLTRRLLCTFQWLERWVAVCTATTKNARDGSVYENLKILRDLMLGAFFFLDMLTLPFQLGNMHKPLLEKSHLDDGAMLCLFYAFAIDVILTSFDVVNGMGGAKGYSSVSVLKTSYDSATSSDLNSGLQDVDTTPDITPNAKICDPTTNLVCSLLDLAVQGDAIGYLSLDDAWVSIAMAASSFVVMHSIWQRICQQEGF